MSTGQIVGLLLVIGWSAFVFSLGYYLAKRNYE